ncbi:component of IIS longevity pathway SMK-1 domain-containing protein [Ditylenchus destructor]|nr:component of IIS longevity pathway SMK-1 domain-containing protein [Ditylenchus destructor]
MKNNTSPVVCSSESAEANDDKAPEEAKPPADEHPVAEDEAAKGKPGLDRIDFVRDAHNRVKLYVLCDQRVWDDRGTGHVACVQSRDQPDAWWIVVRLESNEKNVLESRILTDTIYQKQQGTLIVWSESDVCDLALSFQEKAGCTEIWDKICQIQGKDPDAEEENDADDQEPSDSSTSGISTSDLESTESLRLLYSIAKNLFLLNQNGLLNELLDEKYFRDIVGMLEYDPAFPEPRKHREFLWEKSKFREILPISSKELKAKIHQTYRLQYVQDVCLPAPSLFEENLLTVLSSHLFFNRGDIVNALLNDKELMKQLFDELRNPSITPKRQRDLTNFLKEFCSFAHSLQPSGPQGREQFFKALMANDVLATIDPCITSSLSSTRAATVELLSMIVDFNPQLFRDYLLKQFRTIPESKNDDLLINKLIGHMLSDKDPEQTAANQMSQALRILLDPESIVSKGDKTDFLPMFYKRAMYSLCKPVVENIKEDNMTRDDYFTANKLALVIDLFCFFVDHHNYSMRTFTVQRNLLRSVLVYLKSRHHFLSLCALRMCRRILSLKDEIYFRYIRDKRILDQIVECFKENGNKYNLLNSAVIEFFEFIRTEEIRSLMEFIIENYWDTFCNVTYVRTFSVMKTRYDQFDFANRSKDESRKREAAFDAPNSPTSTNAQWLKEKEYDNDELFFSKDEDENWYKAGEGRKEVNGGDTGSLSKSGTDFNTENMPQRKSGVEPLFPSLARKRKANDEDGVASIFGGNITPPISSTPNSRISNKIVIKMTPQQRLQPQQMQPQSSQPPNKPEKVSQAGESLWQKTFDDFNTSKEGEFNSAMRIKKASMSRLEDDEESIVSSSSSSPPKCSSPSSSSPNSPPHSLSQPVSSAAMPSASSPVSQSIGSRTDPIILKQGFAGLVDYDESDDSDEEDDQKEGKGDTKKVLSAENEANNKNTVSSEAAS